MDATKVSEFVRSIYQTKDFIPLHSPTFRGNEKKYVNETIESTFVSSVGQFVNDFEVSIENYTGAPKAVATVNGTAALHTALYMAGVRSSDYIITQALTFVATCNAALQMGVEPIFVDVSLDTMGLCPIALETFLTENAVMNNGRCYLKKTKRVIKAVVPMHTFGHPVQLDELVSVCSKWNLSLIEDAAESLGSFYKGKHTGTFGEISAISFNGNKVITTGGGGMVLCNSVESGLLTKHVTTTAKTPHPYEFFHDQQGFNYRMPNINAALGLAQMESLNTFLKAKRQLASQYQAFFKDSEYRFFVEPENCSSNYWLNAVICDSKSDRVKLIEETNKAGIMTRPIWQLMHRLPMFSSAIRDSLDNSLFIESRCVNLPSTPPL